MGKIGQGGKRPRYLEGAYDPVPSEDQGLPVAKDLGEDEQIMSWSVWLLPKRPIVAVIVIGVLAISLILSYLAVRSVIFLFAASVILLSRLAVYLFPTRYFLNRKTVGYKTFLAQDVRLWSDFYTYRQDRGGVLLALDTSTVRGRIKGGLFLYYATEDFNEEKVLGIVEERLGPRKGKSGGESTFSRGGVSSAWRRVRKLKDKNTN